MMVVIGIWYLFQIVFFLSKESLILTYNFSYSIKPENTELSLSIVLVINKAYFA